VKQRSQRLAFVYEGADVAFRFGQDQSAFQAFESSSRVRLIDQGLKGKDGDGASMPLLGLRCL
jgi:hypothetical protein